ncbi:MAG: metallophosphoesterase [Bacillota bacterium]|nr:metallophosphoesterase [Bacillota bacterium]
MIYVIGDLHLSFSTGKPMDKFGEEWKNHYEKIQTDWLSKVKEDDIVMLAGDTSWAMRYHEVVDDFKWIDALPGKKLIIKGNHDYWWSYRARLAAEFKSVFFVNSNSYEYGRYAIVGTRGWDYPAEDDAENKKIYERELVRLENSLKSVSKDKIIIAMIHYPPTSKGEETAFTKLFERYGVKKVYYGHLHSRYGFQNAFIGTINQISYELISCDYKDFKLTEVAGGSGISVDRTEFREASYLLEERLRGIHALEKASILHSSENRGSGSLDIADKSDFVEFNYALAKRTADCYTGEILAHPPIDDLDPDLCEELDEQNMDLLRVAFSMSSGTVLSVADGIIKYHFVNSLAKRQMSLAERFEFSNLQKCLRLRGLVYRLYEIKDQMTLGLCKHLIDGEEKPYEISFYKIYLRSSELSGKIYEISAIADEKIVLHTTCQEVVDLLKKSGRNEGEMQNSKISAYVNVKMY